METNPAVTDWISQLQDGRSSACDKLWPFYLQRLTNLIRKKLQTSRMEVSDEEDVLIDTCEVCFRKIKAGTYPNIASRDDLWRMLTKIATRKSIDQIRRSRKGVDRLRLDPIPMKQSGSTHELNPVDAVVGSEPTPEFAAMVADESRYRLEQVPQKMKKAVMLRLQGNSLKEISRETGLSIPTVQRYLNYVREIWQEDELGRNRGK